LVKEIKILIEYNKTYESIKIELSRIKIWVMWSEVGTLVDVDGYSWKIRIAPLAK